LLTKPAVAASRPVRELAPPRWARELVGENFAILTARVCDVPDLSSKQFEHQTFDAYVSIADRLARSPLRHPVRFWNHVPFITDPADRGRDNYMVFNAG